MRTWIQFIVVFAVGLGLGAFAHARVTMPKNPSDQLWKATYSEENVHGKVLQFQHELESIGVPKDADELLKQVEAQREILDLITKYRESEFAKYTPFSGLVGIVLGAILGALGSFVSRLVSKRSSGINPNS